MRVIIEMKDISLEQAASLAAFLVEQKITFRQEPALLQTPVMLSLQDFKELRLKSGLTLREVEERTGISNAYLSQLENKKIKRPSFDVVLKLTDFYASCNGA